MTEVLESLNMCSIKSSGRDRGSSSLRRMKSVTGDDRVAPAKAVVEAYGDHIHVLADAIKRTGNDGIRDGERIVRVAHEQVVVFKTDRPVRCKAVLGSDAHGRTPAGRACGGHTHVSGRGKNVETIARHRRAALQVEQCRVPGITDLAGEKAQAINSRACHERRID